jgi:hypothetical protein
MENTMNSVSFGHDWPWLGGIVDLLLLYLLFGTTSLQADTTKSRWRDRTWLAWAAVFIYLAHNIEEYGVDALGRTYEFPAALEKMFEGAVAVPPNAFYLAVNFAIVWTAMPIAALVSKRHPLVGLAGYSVMAINFFAHAVAFFVAGYNPGLLTALLMFVPMTIWMARALFGPGKMGQKGFAVVIIAGIIIHAILAGSMLSYIHGLISTGALVALQILNAILLLIILWIGERALGERLYWKAS